MDWKKIRFYSIVAVFIAVFFITIRVFGDIAGIRAPIPIIDPFATNMINYMQQFAAYLGKLVNNWY